MADRPGVDEGLALIRRHVRPLDIETIPITAGLGRVTAEEIVARRTVPGFRAAAMDGFVVCSGDVEAASLAQPVLLPITGSVAAGEWPDALPAGEAWRISTGAPVPDGGDSVVMIEHAVIGQDHRLKFDGAVPPGRNVRQIGEDVVGGRPVLEAGVVVTPDMIAGFAAYGIDTIAVRRTPSIALLVTGSEIASAGEASIADSNGPMIRASAQALGVAVASTETVRDEPHAIDRALDRACAAPCDMVICSGGASRGEHDGVAAAFERRGATMLFHGLAMRPGKPIIFASLPDGRPVFGLPGNPVSACVGMRFFVTHAIRGMLGLPAEEGLAVDSEETGRPATSVFLRGRLSQGPGGRLAVDTGFDQRSHILSSLMAANCWLRIDMIDGAARHRAFTKLGSL